VIVHLDYETRSRADLKTVGAYRYAADESFEILMAGVSADDSDRVYLWVNPKYETPDMLSDPEALELLNKADLIYAHNAPFEIAATWGSHWLINLSKWRCTAAMARRAGMPPSLDKCAEALGLTQQKDKKGAALIRKFSIPNKDGTFNAPKDFPDEWLAFGEYCKQDVRTEKAIHKKLKAFELTGEPLETFLFDLRMNHAGIPVNRQALLNAQKIVTDVQSTVTKQFVELTQLQPTQREKVREMVGLADMTSDTVAGALGDTNMDTDKRKILSLYQKLSYAAVKKIETMLDCVCPDGRVRGCHTYYGAGTGRWSGRLIQPQNFKKTPRWMKGLTDQIYADVIAGKDADYLDLMYGDPFELLSGIIRHFIHGDCEMLDGDYNAIEARIICWLAGEKEMLAMWATGRDLYRFMASSVYGIPEAAVDGDGRDHGKRIILGCFESDTPVLTKTGWKPILQITSGDWLWDGLDWVQSGGVIFQGCKKTIQLHGVGVTPDHKILCAGQWVSAESVALSANILSRALATGSENLPSPGIGSELGEGYVISKYNAPAAKTNILSSPIISEKENLLGATIAQNSKPGIIKRNIWGMPILYPTTPSEKGSSIEYPRLLVGVTAPQTNNGSITEVEASKFINRGGMTEKSFYDTSFPYPDTSNNRGTLTGLIVTGGTNREICVLPQNQKTWLTDAMLPTFKKGLTNWKLKSNNSVLRETYDIVDCGPRHRFTILTEKGPMIVHNCGYGMGPAKFKATCEAYGVECSEDLAESSVKAYRQTHPNVVKYWYFLDRSARSAIAEPGTQHGPFTVRSIAGIPYLLGRLPSGRSIAYPYPKIEIQPGDDRDQITYWGQLPVGVTWGRVKIYGGKFAENFSQGVAADIMSNGARVAEARGMMPFTLIHDQGLALRTKQQSPDEFSAALASLPDWARGLPLKVESKVAPYYRK
jgi:hypothetical protein